VPGFFQVHEVKQDTDEGQKTDVAADGVDDAYYIFEAKMLPNYNSR
jgi:hypothetical protein